MEEMNEQEISLESKEPKTVTQAKSQMMSSKKAYKLAKSRLQDRYETLNIRNGGQSE